MAKPFRVHRINVERGNERFDTSKRALRVVNRGVQAIISAKMFPVTRQAVLFCRKDKGKSTQKALLTLTWAEAYYGPDPSHPIPPHRNVQPAARAHLSYLSTWGRGSRRLDPTVKLAAAGPTKTIGGEIEVARMDGKRMVPAREDWSKEQTHRVCVLKGKTREIMSSQDSRVCWAHSVDR
jgi:hypothetical protein